MSFRSLTVLRGVRTQTWIQGIALRVFTCFFMFFFHMANESPKNVASCQLSLSLGRRAWTQKPADNPPSSFDTQQSTLWKTCTFFEFPCTWKCTKMNVTRNFDTQQNTLSQTRIEIPKNLCRLQPQKSVSQLDGNLKNLRDFHTCRKRKSTFYFPLKSEKSARFPPTPKPKKHALFSIEIWKICEISTCFKNRKKKRFIWIELHLQKPGQENFQKPGLQKFQGNLQKPGPLKFYKISRKSTHHPHQEIMKVVKPGPLKF